MINREARAITRCLKTTPLGPLIAEASLTPATVLLDHRQRRYADRIAGLPKNQWVKNNEDEDFPYEPAQTRKTNGGIGPHLGQIIRKSLTNKAGIEPIIRSNHTTKRKAIIKDKITAIEEAIKASNANSILFTDGSRLETGNLRCSVVWRAPDGSWKTQKTHLGKNKETFDAELFAIAEALKLVNRKVIGNHATHLVRIFADSTAALKRIQEDNPGPGQWTTRTIIKIERTLMRAGWHIEYHWVPGHSKAEGNEKAARAAKDAAQNPRTQGIAPLQSRERFTLMAHLHRVTKEKKTSETKLWLKNTIKDRPNYPPPSTLKPGQAAMAARKRLALRYYQLKTGHALTGTHLKRIKAIEDDRCWLCDNGDRQTVSHLFKECRRWRRRIE